MATRVSLSGSNVIVNQDGESVLRIPQRLCIYSVLQPSASADGLTLPEPQYIMFKNSASQESRTELISEVEDDMGGMFSDFLALQSYLSFIWIKNSILVVKQPSDSDEISELITLNTEMLHELTDININTLDLDRIKDLIKKTNKILTKIYN